MKTLMRHHDKKVYRLIFPFLGLAFILLTVTLLNTPFFFTYRSRANEDVINTFDKTQASIETVRIQEDLPSCVSSFLYTPVSKNDLHSCLVQFICVDAAAKTFFPPPHFSCIQDGTRFTCSENVTHDQKECGLVDEWLIGAAFTCGCEK